MISKLESIHIRPDIFVRFSWRGYSSSPPHKNSALTASFSIKQPACNLPRLSPAALALFPVCQVRLLHVKELCPGTVDSQSAAQLAHCRITLSNPFTSQFRAAESSVHLQEHLGHFPFRREERPAAQLRPHAFPYQIKVLFHLAEKEQILYPAQFALLKSGIVELIKIELRKRNVWRYFRKISYF